MVLSFFRKYLGPSQDDTEAPLEKNGSPLPLHNPPEGAPIVLLEEIEEQIKKLPESKQNTVRTKIQTYKDKIQPHTDEGGDAHYIGDAYDEVDETCHKEWSDDQQPGPYLQYIQAISKKLKHLEYLVFWMLVGCAPPKWRFIKTETASRLERIQRTKVCVIDYRDLRAAAPVRYKSTDALKSFLNKVPDAGEPEIRLVVVEDLSRNVVEMLGEHYDVDPLFFLSHIGDYLFHNTRDRWVELPDLEVDAKKRLHFNLQYLRPRYFKTERDFDTAEMQSGGFNVLRRLDSDRSRKSMQHGLLDKPDASVTLTRAKSSLWIQPRKAGEPVVAILLVDPSVENGHPIWGGYRPFESTPSMKQWKAGNEVDPDSPPRKSLFEDVIYWSCKMTPEELETVKEDPKYIALPMYKLIIADWLVVLKYMTTMFGLIEWSFSKPHWGESPADIDELLKKLAPWRRNISYYQKMVDDAIVRLFPSIAVAYPTTPANLVVPAPNTASGIYSLWTDFEKIKYQMEEHKRRIGSIQTMATNAINTEEARRAVKQNKNLARLTFLATFFIPLNFTSSFLSMSPNFGWSNTLWLFFAIGLPITILAFVLVDWTRPGNKGVTRQAYIKYIGKYFFTDETKPVEAMGQQAVQPGGGIKKRSKTFAGSWPYYRANSSYVLK